MKESVLHRIRSWQYPLLLLVVSLAVYGRTLNYGFQLFWDDRIYLCDNPMVHGFSFDNIRRIFTEPYFGNYAPLHLLSYMADYSIWGLDPRGYHLINLVVHAANGLLFFRLLTCIGLERSWAALSSCIFLVHPVQVENVAWISERKSLLALFFVLLSLLAWHRYREQGRAVSYLGSLMFFLCALFSKSVAVTLPVILVLFDLCFVERSRRNRWIIDKLPFTAGSLLIAWLTVLVQKPGELPGMGGGVSGWHGGSPYATFLTMLTVIPRYVQLVLAPTGLSIIYDPPVQTSVNMAVISGVVICLLLAALGVLLYRRRKALFFFYALFFVALLPVMQIVPIVTLMNDRYLYLSMMGGAVCIGSVAQLAGLPTVACHAAKGVVALLLVALPVLAFQRAGVWRSERELWGDAARKSPGHHVALYGLGQALQNSGDLEGARPLYLKVLETHPVHLDTLMHLAALYTSRKEPLEGRQYLLTVTRSYPRLAEGWQALAENYYQTGELAQAEDSFRKALDLKPQSAGVLRRLGVISLSRKQNEAAREYFLRAASLAPLNAETAYNMACAASLTGRLDEAARYLEEALRLGFRGLAALQNDPDLAALRATAEYTRIINGLH